MSPSPSAFAARRPSFWPALALISAVAVGAGLFLPRLLSDEPAVAANRTQEQNAPGELRYSPPALPEVPSAQAMLVRLACGTIFVLGLCVVTLVYGKRWLGPWQAPGANGTEMRVVETLYLGNRCCLHLVQLKTSRQVLIGTDAAGLKTVVPLPLPFEPALTQATDEPLAADTV
jgi:hypothetical protein